MSAAVILGASALLAVVLVIEGRDLRFRGAQWLIAGLAWALGSLAFVAIAA